MTSINEPSVGTAPAAAPQRDRKAMARTIGAAVLGGLLVLFAALNSQTVTVHWIVTTTGVPLIVVILVCAVVGIAVGWLLTRRRARRDSNEA